jgi:hypothetical protein
MVEYTAVSILALDGMTVGYAGSGMNGQKQFLNLKPLPLTSGQYRAKGRRVLKRGVKSRWL